MLIVPGTWDGGGVRHASYTLRLGPHARLIDPVTPGPDVARVERVVAISRERPLELRPGQTALLFSHEEVSLAPDFLGFTVARGLLYGEALVPENTYVDPGFRGALYTTVVNVSSRVITLHYLMPIARLFFYRLHAEVEEPYRSGHARGIDQQLASVPAVPLATEAEAKQATDKTLSKLMAATGPAGLLAAEIAARSRARFVALALLALGWPPAFLGIMHLGITNPVIQFLVAIVAGLVATSLTALGAKALRRWTS